MISRGGLEPDSIGVVSADAYESLVPNLQKPSLTASGMKSLVCFVKHMLTGSFATRDIPVQSSNSHLCMDQIENYLDGFESMAGGTWVSGGASTPGGR